MKPVKRQDGVALVTAILLVAIATMLATKLAWDNRVSMRRTEMILEMEQARLFALGAEAVAIDVLRQDDKAFDNSSEDWAQVTPPLEIGIDENVMGQMQGYMTDAQGRFNLNNLVPAPGGEPSERAVQQFSRLLDILGLDPGIVDAVIDWIDEDTLPRPGGVEDDFYTNQDPPYRAANSYLRSVSELRSIANIDAETYDLLLPHVTALDPNWCGANGVTPININSATAVVIESISEEISSGQAQAWVEERGETGWESFGDITDWPASLQPLVGSEVDVTSNCFELKVLVNVGSSLLSMYSLLDRSGLGDEISTRVRNFGLE